MLKSLCFCLKGANNILQYVQENQLGEDSALDGKM